MDLAALTVALFLKLSSVQIAFEDQAAELAWIVKDQTSQNLSFLYDASGASLDSSKDSFPLHGDGVFETILIVEGKAPHWPLHRSRLLAGLSILSISASIDIIENILFRQMEELASARFYRLRLQVFRAPASAYQGYSCLVPSSFFKIECVPIEEPVSRAISLCESDIKHAAQPELAGIKHQNRLPQVLAAQHLNNTNISSAQNYGEALMFDQELNLVSVIAANIFLLVDNRWITPELDHAGVEGTTRQWLLDKVFPQFKTAVQIQAVSRAHLLSAESLFICNAIKGITHIENLELADGRSRQLEVGELQKQLAQTWLQSVGVK